MLGCENTITIVHHVKEPKGDTYSCTTYEKASLYKRNTITTSSGAKPSNTYEVRIMTTDDITVTLGDHIVIGKISDVVKPSDLNGVDSFRITAISDNRRGNLAHWRFSGQ